MAKRKRRLSGLPAHLRPSFPTLAAFFLATDETQERAAFKIGTSQAHLSRIKNGITVPRPALAVRIAEYANVPMDSFQRVYLARLQRERKVVA